MASADRLLSLLSLLTVRGHWTAVELAERLEITERTVRRDIARLRELGYAVDSDPGLHGGYQMAAGSRLPPLVLDDDEAMVIAMSLASVAAAGGERTGEAAVKALVKLDRILPPRLRERAHALHAVTLGLTGTRLPATDTDALVVIALACERPERMRFEYLDASERVTSRHVEPYRLVFTSMRWYLVAFDRDRDDWRTFRVDRMSEIKPTGIPFERGEVPDAVAQVAAGVAVHAYDQVATIRFHMSLREVERQVPRTVGVVAEVDGDTVLVKIGGDPDWVARFLLGIEGRVEVVDSPDVVTELRRMAEQVLVDHR
jgi:predicted DNA-binding transcriptional regulator YafY